MSGRSRSPGAEESRTPAGRERRRRFQSPSVDRAGTKSPAMMDIEAMMLRIGVATSSNVSRGTHSPERPAQMIQDRQRVAPAAKTQLPPAPRPPPPLSTRGTSAGASVTSTKLDFELDLGEIKQGALMRDIQKQESGTRDFVEPPTNNRIDMLFEIQKKGREARQVPEPRTDSRSAQLLEIQKQQNAARRRIQELDPEPEPEPEPQPQPQPQPQPPQVMDHLEPEQSPPGEPGAIRRATTAAERATAAVKWARSPILSTSEEDESEEAPPPPALEPAPLPGNVSPTPELAPVPRAEGKNLSEPEAEPPAKPERQSRKPKKPAPPPAERLPGTGQKVSITFHHQHQREVEELRLENQRLLAELDASRRELSARPNTSGSSSKEATMVAAADIAKDALRALQTLQETSATWAQSISSEGQLEVAGRAGRISTSRRLQVAPRTLCVIFDSPLRERVLMIEWDRSTRPRLAGMSNLLGGNIEHAEDIVCSAVRHASEKSGLTEAVLQQRARLAGVVHVTDLHSSQAMMFVVTMELDGSVAKDYVHDFPEGHTHWVDQKALDELIATRRVFADVEPILQRCRLTAAPLAAGDRSAGTRVWTACGTCQYDTGGTLLDLSFRNE